MSEINATIERVERLEPIEGADRLQSALIGGFPVIINKDYQEGEKVVYFPMGLEMPPYVAKTFDVEKFLRKGRVVKAVRLKGALSYGLALSVERPTDPNIGVLNNYPVGEKVDWFFGTRKYEPPVSVQASRFGLIDKGDPRLLKFTDIDRLNKFGNVLEGLEVVITEKIHGTNVRIATIDGELLVGSRQMQRKEPPANEISTNWFWYPTQNDALRYMLYELSRNPDESLNQVILFGETYGSSVWSKFHYDVNGLNFRAFDIMVNGRYLDYPEFNKITRNYGIPTVPVDYYGIWNPELAAHLAQHHSNLTRSHIREGIVVRTTTEMMGRKVGRYIFKILNPDFDTRVSEGKIEDATEE